MPSHYTIRQAENEATIYLYGDITADGEDAGTRCKPVCAPA